MAKPVTPVNRKLLEQALQQAERNGPLKNLGELWKAAAKIYNQLSDHPITFSVVSLRVKEWGIQVKTKPGRRGGPMTEEHKAALRAGRGNRRPRSEKMKEFSQTFDRLRRELSSPELMRFLPVLDAAEKGSLTAAIKLKCLDCCCYQTPEIKQCATVDCSLYPHRPYKPGTNNVDEGKSEEEEELAEAC